MGTRHTKIIKECELAGIPEPVFSYDSSDISVAFRKDIYNEKYLKALKLNNRQVKAVLFVKDNGKYQTLNNCSRNTASNDLTELVDKDLHMPSGQKGAGAFYTLK